MELDQQVAAYLNSQYFRNWTPAQWKRHALENESILTLWNTAARILSGSVRTVAEASQNRSN